MKKLSSTLPPEAIDGINQLYREHNVQLPMTLCVLTPTEKYDFTLKMKDENERQMLLVGAACFIKATKAFAYRVTSEIWMTKHDVDETPRVRPKDSEQRQEGLMVLTVQRDNPRDPDSATTKDSELYVIERDAAGVASIDSERRGLPGDATVGGAFTQLLDRNVTEHIPAHRGTQYAQWFMQFADTGTISMVGEQPKH